MDDKPQVDRSASMRTPRAIKNPIEVPEPGYKVERPQYPAFREFRIALGSQVTAFNLTELSLRYFESRMAAADDHAEFVNQMCDRFSINSSLGIDWEAFRREAHYQSTTQLISVADDFLRNIASEYRLYHEKPHEKWIKRKNGEDLNLLEALVENISDAGRVTASECPEYDLLQYYRSIRNRFIHRTEKETDKRLERLIKKHGEALTKSYKRLPSKWEDISYNDLIVFAVAVKNYSSVLNDACDLSGSLVAKVRLQQSDFLIQLRKRRSRPSAIAGLTSQTAAEFGMDEKNKLEFQDAVHVFLDSDLSKKERSRRNNAKT
jgi:hypothetical protein